MNVWKKISICIVIALLLFSAGFLTSFAIGRNERSKLVDEYELRVAEYEEAAIGTDKIIADLGLNISNLGQKLDKRKALDRDRENLDKERIELDKQWKILNDARASEISRYRNTIQQLENSEREGTDSLSRIEQYYREIAKRIREAGEED